jgi:hypothetical protein
MGDWHKVNAAILKGDSSKQALYTASMEFAPHFEKRKKFDAFLEDPNVPQNLKTPITDKAYLQKILRRARQNKHKREMTAMRQHGGSSSTNLKSSLSQLEKKVKKEWAGGEKNDDDSNSDADDSKSDDESGSDKSVSGDDDDESGGSGDNDTAGGAGAGKTKRTPQLTFATFAKPRLAGTGTTTSVKQKATKPAAPAITTKKILVRIPVLTKEFQTFTVIPDDHE